MLPNELAAVRRRIEQLARRPNERDRTEITTLDHGLSVATETMASVQTASVGVWVDVGARYEAAEVNGVAHMLEHMAFKGTERRSARAIAEAIENVGGQLNAYTSREHTAYYARVLADDLPLAVDMLADILQHSAFDEAELARERGVVAAGDRPGRRTRPTT